MTTVTIFRSKGKIIGFEASGHTGYSEEGSDIVCSAVSALTQGALIGLTEVLGLHPAIRTGDAGLSCRLSGVSESDLEKADLILKTMALSLRSAADTYGSYIKIVEREV